jgi:hypothetical protein
MANQPMPDSATTTNPQFPRLRQTVLDSTDARRLAEFYRQLLGFEYRAGDEPPLPGEVDVAAGEFLVIRDPSTGTRVAFQQVATLPESTWPTDEIPQQLHLDLSVTTKQELDHQHERALNLGARLLRDESDDEEEPIRIYADPAGHPFCIFVAAN